MLIHRTLAIRAPSDDLSIDAHQLAFDSSNPASPTQDHVDPDSAGRAIQSSLQLAAECITRSNSMGSQFPLSSTPAFAAIAYLQETELRHSKLFETRRAI
jgi:hypothetical protein